MADPPRKKRKRTIDVQELLENSQNKMSKQETQEKHLAQLKSNSVSTEHSVEYNTVLLVAKIGMNNMLHLLQLVNSIPDILPEKVRCKLLSDKLQSEHLSDMDPAVIFHVLDSMTTTYCASPEADVLCPPTSCCLECDRSLSTNNAPTKVVVMGLSYPYFRRHTKVCLRCKSCGIFYNYSSYGNKDDGFRFYDVSRPLVEATDAMLMTRDVMELFACLGNHAWVSFQAFTEAFLDAFTSDFTDLDRRTLAKAFWWSELETELRQELLLEYRFQNENFDDCMHMIEKRRQRSLYLHKTCTDACQRRGCGKLWVIDGLWKLIFQHCMFRKKNYVNGLPLINFPDVCTSAVKPGHAFCIEHCAVLSQNNIPTKLRPFLQHAGVLKDGLEGDADLSDFSTAAKISKALKKLPDMPGKGSAVIDMQVGKTFLRSTPLSSLLKDCTQTEKTGCTKDSGERRRLRQFSRGHLFIVRGGGFIDMFCPLYQSESLGQVFLTVISWLYQTLKRTGTAPNKLWLCYDNMCNLKKLKAACNVLPLPAPYSHMWLEINKAIDAMHLKNHKNLACHTDLNPERFNNMYPNIGDTKNTSVCEQTNVWAGRFKKIVCAMSLPHHMFYMHRMIKRRNHYTEKCYIHGRKPVLPVCKSVHTT